MFKKLFAILSIATICTGLTACNTMAGAGKDIERGGEHVQDAAKNTQQKMKQN